MTKAVVSLKTLTLAIDGSVTATLLMGAFETITSLTPILIFLRAMPV